MDQPPLSARGHRVFVALAEEADVVGVLQVLQPNRITTKFPVIEPNCPGVLPSPVYQLNFTFAADALRYCGCHGREPNRDKCEKQHHHDQDIAFLPRAVLEGARMRMYLHVLRLRQRDRLAVVVEHVLDLDRGRIDAHHPVAAINDLSFLSDKHVFALGQEDALTLTRMAGETEKL